MAAEDANDAAVHPPEFSWLCRHLSERSPQPMLALEGPEHLVVYLNPAFAAFFGQPAEVRLGQPFAEAVLEGVENGCLGMLDRVFATGVSETLLDQEHLQRDGSPAWWSYLAWAVPGEGGRPTGVLVQVTDATEVVRFRARSTAMNEALLVSSVRQHELAEVAESLAERLQGSLRARDHFIAALSHELRNPLAPLTVGVELLSRAATPPSDAERVRTMMGRQLKQMVRLVDDLLDASRITMGKLRIHKEPVDLATVIRDTVDACRSLFEHHGHTLVVVLPPEPIVFDADPVRLTQILTNLLNNAARYTDGAGRVRLSAARDGDEIVLCVQDEGIGIPPDRLHHVFEPFVQVDTTWKRAQGGLGIGLSLVRELVELHGGRVEARSAGLGTGCEFVVRLPATVAAPVVEARVAVLHGPSRRVLVVDDNQDAADTLALLLGMSGHEVRTAHDGAMAVQLASAFRPDVILMDLGMPKMDGYEAARRIRATPHGAEPFLVALTGWGDDADRRRTREAGFDRHVVKPVDPDELERLVAELGASDEQSEPLTA